MDFIDFHSHVYPEAIAAKATASTCDFYDIVTPYIGTPEEKLRVDRENGIIKSVILPVAVLPRHVHSINEFTRKTAREHPEFLPFGTVHAADENILDEVSLFGEMGLKGIKMHPDMQRFDIDDKRLMPLYDMIQGKLPVMFHSGDPRYTWSHPEKIKRMLHEFPKLTVIAAHMGGWSFQETAFPLLKNEEHCFVDTSSSTRSLPTEKTMEYIRGYGVQRVLFGSDYPVGDPAGHIETLLSLPLTDDEKEMIAHKNAEAFIAEFCK